MIFFQWIAGCLEAAVKAILGWSLDIIQFSPEPNLTSLWYRGEYHLMLQIGGYLVVAVALCATISDVLKGGLKEVLRTYFVGIPTAILGSIAAIAVIAMMQKVDQDMTVAVLNHTRQYFNDFFNNLDEYGNSLVNIDTAILEILIFLIILVFTCILWLEMVFRQVMIYMSALFIPLGFAAYVWPPLRSWFVGLAEVVATMVFSKFIIAAVMSFGFISINQGLHDPDGVSNAIAALIGGLITIIVACCAAPVLISFVMAPSHEIVSRASIQNRLPGNADNASVRGRIGRAAGSMVRGVGNLFRGGR